MTPETDSNSERDSSVAGEFEDLNRTFELQTISHLPNETGPANQGNLERKDSLDEQRGLTGGSGRKESFMLYTPDEERAVVKRLDRRLVLFMAFLYMLSFLDRSSKVRQVCCNSLTQRFQTLAMQRLQASLPISISVHRSMSGF